eukprot:CAMPEP_0175049180 /NCGR_PEP_ID=MMETSP0052_2-20121109/6597_1 /TAXON_ID=51329 ORGANISM="Polytomella parva, Strain SAG 63-3" /NCGR_SAMPLE_ID=MMETSP0052_2 /ASSEMBLY_ACC=CAM_ASM_000194 /LENGTH=474 /DNA_ID=CAMNT_0016313317 /DNA_START=91 /DNA_END=1518 /DNA_ORIENTATION=+
MSDKYSRNRGIWIEVVSQLIALGGALLAAKFAMSYLDPYKEQKEQARKRSLFLRQRLGRNLELNEYEMILAANVMNPNDIDVEMSDVKGLDHIIDEIELKVLLPLNQPQLYCTTLLRQAKGVLLYGPPGTGKTMIARAIARQSKCFFLNVTVSSLLSKWLGDANKLVKAAFTLAEKLQPCIIFVDEVDALLSKRGSSSEHEATLQLKTEFMQLWDGMESSAGQRVVVLGATNRPYMVDDAVLRRFTLQFKIGLPDVSQRKAILEGYLRRHHHDLGGDKAVDSHLLEDSPYESPKSGWGVKKGLSTQGKGALTWLAERTVGFSGSDLLELCVQAAQKVAAEGFLFHREKLKHQGSHLRSRGVGEWDRFPGATVDGSLLSDGEGEGGGRGEDQEEVIVALRPVTLGDFDSVLQSMKPSSAKAEEYRRQTEQVATPSGGMSSDMVEKMLYSFLANAADTLTGSEGGEEGKSDKKNTK